MTISARLARGARARAGRVDGGEEADREAGDRHRRRSAAASARRAPGRRRCAPPARRRPVSPSCANAHTTSGTVATSDAAERRSARAAAAARTRTTARARSPPRAASRGEGEQQARRSARPRPGHASTLTAAWPERRAREPQHRRDAERGGQPDAVPVLERRAQPRERLVRRERSPGRPSSAAPSRHSAPTRARCRRAAPPSGPARAGPARARPRTPPGRRACGWSPATTRSASATS